MLAIVFAAVFLGSLYPPPLLDDADSTHAEAAREMFVSGDYITLHVNGVRYLEKAPLPYWLVVASYHVFGVNEFATRLPMALSVPLSRLAFCSAVAQLAVVRPLIHVSSLPQMQSRNDFGVASEYDADRGALPDVRSRGGECLGSGTTRTQSI